MTKYRIGIVQTVWEGTDITVEANNLEEASEKALEIARRDVTLNWRFIDASGDFEVTDFDVIEPTCCTYHRTGGDLALSCGGDRHDHQD